MGSPPRGGRDGDAGNGPATEREPSRDELPELDPLDLVSELSPAPGPDTDVAELDPLDLVSELSPAPPPDADVPELDPLDLVSEISTAPPDVAAPPPVPHVRGPRAQAPTKPPPPRRTAHSLPPPIPAADRRIRPAGRISQLFATTGRTPTVTHEPAVASLVTGRLEVPTALERAIAGLGDHHRVRAERLARELDAKLGGELHAYELGALYERHLGEPERALAAYRRAAAHGASASFVPARWALHRVLYDRANWRELLTSIGRELEHAPDEERVELTLEHAFVAEHVPGSDIATTLGNARSLAPDDQLVLLELERALAGTPAAPAMLDVLEHLARVAEHPVRKVVYQLELARRAAATDYARAAKAIAAAAELAASTALAVPIARERLAIAEMHGEPAAVVSAVDALLAELREIEHPSARADEVALHYRRAQLLEQQQPIDALRSLQEAIALAPDEPVLLLGLIELAADLGRYKELLVLARTWKAAEHDVGRREMSSLWAAEARLGVEQRERSRPRLGAVAATAPGFVLLTAAAECDALADIKQSQHHLANVYAEAAQSAETGVWVGPGSMLEPAPAAAAALYLQSAELLAHHVGGATSVERARELLARAEQLAPEHPAVLESILELGELVGPPTDALHRLDELSAAGPAARAYAERGVRVALAHDSPSSLLQYLRRLVELAPDEHAPAWWLALTLEHLATTSERADLLVAIADKDADPARQRTALLYAALLHARTGNHATALELFVRLRTLLPDDRFVSDSYVELLRGQERWSELVPERRLAGQRATDDELARRAFREAAWVLEIRADDATRAAEVYGEWLARLPGDRAALEGLARCWAHLRNPAREVVAREQITELDPTADARWLYARSLERAGRSTQAIEQYRLVALGEERCVAAANAALALADLASTGANASTRIEAAEALAAHTTDPQLAATLYEQTGWCYLLALRDATRASAAFASALAHHQHRGALIGAALADSRHAGPRTRAMAYAALAAQIPEHEIAAMLYLRAAAIADDNELRREYLAAARTSTPESPNVLVVAAELPIDVTSDTDPFAAIEHMLARAELLALRGALADSQAARVAWEIERAEALEQAGELQAAAVALAEVLRYDENDYRALSVLRRVASRAKDDVLRAHASYALARVSASRENKLRLLREAAGIYDRGSEHRAFAITAYRRIVAIDSAAPEAQRLLALLRESDDPSGLVDALTGQLKWLGATVGAEHRIVPHLLERATLLRTLGRLAEACADLDALLDHAPTHLEALHARADLAMEAGELKLAIELWNRYLSTEPTGSDRTEIEQRLATALERRGRQRAASPAPSTATNLRTVADEADSLAWEAELTDPEPLAPVPSLDAESVVTSTTGAPRRTAHTIPRQNPADTKADPLDENTVTGDPFGAPTALVDVSSLQEQERRAALARPPDADTTTRTSDVPGRRSALHTVPARQTGQRSIVSTTNEANSISTATTAEIPSRVKAFADEKTQASENRVLHLPEVTDVAPARDLEPVLDPMQLQIQEADALNDESAAVVLSYDQLQPWRADEPEEALADCERELAAREGARPVALELEAGRLAEILGELDQAWSHYEAALLADPKSIGALRGLRRIARKRGELAEVARLLAVELALAEPRERAALAHHRLDTLLAAGDHDLARVAAGELLDSDASDLAALFAQLELALADERGDELEAVLQRLTRLADPELRAAMLSALGVLSLRRVDTAGAARYFAEAAAADQGSPALRLEAIRDTAARGETDAAGLALLELAQRVDRDDPVTAAAMALRAATWIASEAGRDAVIAAVQLAARSAPRDPLVGRLSAELALALDDRALAVHALGRWLRCKTSSTERAFAAARAAELDPEKLGRLWAEVIELDGGDDYAAAKLREHHAKDTGEGTLELDLAAARTSGSDVPLVRAGFTLFESKPDRALELLADARHQRPDSWAIGLVLAEMLASVGRWHDAANVRSELVASPGPLAPDVLRLQIALVLHAAVRGSPQEHAEAASIAALDAWHRVLEDDPRSYLAHASAITLATKLDDPAPLVRVLGRARNVERSPHAAASLSLRYARALRATNSRLTSTIAREIELVHDDPRATLVWMLAAADRNDPDEAATALDSRATLLEASPTPTPEPTMLRLRAACLALDAGAIERAQTWLTAIHRSHPALADDLLAVASQRAGSPEPWRTKPAESFARVVYDAEAAVARGDRIRALQLYQRALHLRPRDRIAERALMRLSMELRAHAPLIPIVRDRVSLAEQQGDPTALAEAYDELARVEEQRGDLAATRSALENATRAAPHRLDLVHRLAILLAAERRDADLLALRERELEQLSRSAELTPADRAALVHHAARLAARAGRPDAEIEGLYRAALAANARDRLAVFHLHVYLSRRGPSKELAEVEELAAELVEDPRAKAAFLSRAGETLAASGSLGDALSHFARAIEVAPDYVLTLDTWLATALRAGAWHDVAEAAIRHAAAATTREDAVARHHLAGVVLMDKLHERDRARQMLAHALDADRGNLDAFLRLRILLERGGYGAEWAELVRARLAGEHEPAAQIELHRMLAEYFHEAGDRDEAVRQCRAMLALDPTDVRAHAAIADFSTSTNEPDHVADAIRARIPLERDVQTLATLHGRIAELLAPRDPAAALEALEQALAHAPDDETTLVKLADLAIATSRWEAAARACERLVSLGGPPDQLAAHLVRAATIYTHGFGDAAAAKRMLQVALEQTPTAVEILDRLVGLYREAPEPEAAARDLDAIANAMRARIAHDLTDGPAYCMLARSYAARFELFSAASLPPAYAAAELARSFGAAHAPEQRILASEPPIDRVRLVGPTAEADLFSHAAEPVMRQLLQQLAEPIRKLVGVDLAQYGVSRRDRLKSTHPTVVVARAIADLLELGNIHVYVTTRHPYAMVAEPTRPISLVLGEAIAAADALRVRFAAGAALQLARLSLAIPARLAPPALAQVGEAALALVSPQARPTATAAGFLPRLQQLVPPQVVARLRAQVPPIRTFDHRALARDLKIAGLRAGLAASGSIVATLDVLAGAMGATVQAILGDPVARLLVEVAVSEPAATR